MGKSLTIYEKTTLGKFTNIISARRFASARTPSNLIRRGSTFILCPSKYNPKNIKMNVVTGNGINDGYAILAKSKIELMYTATLLNTYIAKLFLTDNHPNCVMNITLSRLSAIPVFILDEETQKNIGILYPIILDLESKIADKTNYASLNYNLLIFKEIVESIYLELLLSNLFKDLNIFILKYWKAEVNKFLYEGELDCDALLNSLLSPSNQLMNNIKKLRIYLRDLTKKLQL